MSDGGTVSVSEGASAVRVGVPWLIRAICCDAPLERPLRICVDGRGVTTLGRGSALGVSLVGTRRGNELVIQLADHRMSTVHARIVHDGARATIEDLGSKNGTMVNGQRCERRALADGDVIEAGHTFLVYRAALPPDLDSGPTWIAGSGHGELPLTTFVPELARQYETLAKIAASQVPIVVLGETGTGKEVVARALHRMSARTGDFIAINCGAIPPNLVESELFGAKRGAFSGAEDRPGLVRAADGGTLFLDEIGELPPAAQVALLRVLQESEVVPVGGTKPVKVDLRVVAATHRALDRLVDENRFRSDLFARLTGFNVRLPALRDRREDLGLIVAGLIRTLAPAAERVRFARPAMRALFGYAFPRNIRELEKAIGLAIAVASSGGKTDIVIELEHLPEEISAPDASVPSAPPTEDELRREQLVKLLVEHRGRIAEVARAFGKARMQIHRWIERYGLDVESYRKP